MRIIILTIILIACVAITQARTVSKDEIINSLKKYEKSDSKINTWLCIIEHESNFQTDAYNGQTGDHGLYQISEIFWCSTSNQPGKACNLTCASLRDDNVDNDTECAMKIYDEWQRIHGDGFKAWVAYKYCH